MNALDQVSTAEVAYITKRLHSGKDDAIDLARNAGLIVCEGRGIVHKYRGDSHDPADLYEVVESPPNLLLTAGITLLWNLLVGNAGTAYNAANTRLAIGTSATAAVIGNTTLGAESARQIVDSAPTISANQVSFVATFGTASANVAWAETAVTNANAGGTLLNRLVSAFGTKTSAASWTYTHSLALN